MRRLVLALALSTAPLACAVAPAPTSTPPSAAATVHPEPTPTAVAPTVVFLVRHAEKASDGSDDPPLTAAGSERATCLSRLLAESGITHVYATELQRTVATVSPLATTAGVTLTQVAAKHTAALVRALTELPPGAVALVAGHSNTIPAIAAELGVSLPGLDEHGYLPHAQYDRLVAIVRAPAITPKLVQLRYCEASGGGE